MGGMGAVWLADRADGLMQRSVALKLPFGPFRGDLAARIAREREILASARPPAHRAPVRRRRRSRWPALPGARTRGRATHRPLLRGTAGSASRRGCACSCRLLAQSRMPMRSWSCTATSSRRTCSSMPEARSSCSTSASPRLLDDGRIDQPELTQQGHARADTRLRRAGADRRPPGGHPLAMSMRSACCCSSC